MPKKNKTKYLYLKIIQSNFGYGWEDESEYETDSAFYPKNNELFKKDYKDKWDLEEN